MIKPHIKLKPPVSEPGEIAYKVGQPVWFFHGNHQGVMTEGWVVHEFKLDGQQLYVIEYDTGIDPCYEVRDWHSMSPAADQPIGLWKTIRNISNQMRKNKAAADKQQAELDGDYNGE
jgi:hypothetical protein